MRTTRIPSPARLITLAAGCLLAGIWACADFSSPEDPTGGVPDVLVVNPQFARDIQPIFTKRCAQGGCHTSASAQLGLVLQAGAAYDSLVNKKATLDTAFVRVKPGDHVNSFLWRMLQPDSTLRDLQPRMPLAATPLTDNQLQTIVNWIDEGAPNN